MHSKQLPSITYCDEKIMCMCGKKKDPGYEFLTLSENSDEILSPGEQFDR